MPRLSPPRYRHDVPAERQPPDQEHRDDEAREGHAPERDEPRQEVPTGRACDGGVDPEGDAEQDRQRHRRHGEAGRRRRRVGDHPVDRSAGVRVGLAEVAAKRPSREVEVLRPQREVEPELLAEARLGHGVPHVAHQQLHRIAGREAAHDEHDDAADDQDQQHEAETARGEPDHRPASGRLGPSGGAGALGGRPGPTPVTSRELRRAAGRATRKSRVRTSSDPVGSRPPSGSTRHGGPTLTRGALDARPQRDHRSP